MGHRSLSDFSSDLKAHLATEICSFSARSISCPHRHFRPHFVDWYRLLGVEEDDAIDSIRRRYLNFALLLHPDKNPHPDAEFAFKLVSQGYACLCDNVKKREFDLDRMKKFCTDCNTIPYRNLSSARNLNPLNILRCCNKHGGLKYMKEKLREEANVIENCLRANNSAATKQTLPFNSNRFHIRNHKKPPSSTLRTMYVKVTPIPEPESTRNRRVFGVLERGIR